MKAKPTKMARNKERKWQFRFYIQLKSTFDFIPVRWKYYKLNTPNPTTLDRHSYAIKWLIFEVHFERVRMNLKQ